MSRCEVSASQLASDLLNEVVENTSLDEIPFLELTPDEEERFRSKMRLYRLAMVIHLLRSEAKTIKGYAKVLSSFEFQALPMGQTEQIPIVMAINTALRDTGDLLEAKNAATGQLWARHWLVELMIDESNPATLAAFAMSVMTMFTELTKMLRNYQPV